MYRLCTKKGELYQFEYFFSSKVKEFILKKLIPLMLIYEAKKGI